MKTKTKLYAIIVITAIIFTIGFVVVNGLDSLQSKALLEEDIKNCFNENKIKYKAIASEKNVLIVDLQSEGSDRCTLEDVKAKDHIYKIIREKYKDEQLKKVQIRIFDINGKVIYNATETIDLQEYNGKERLSDTYKSELISLSSDPEIAVKNICKKHKATVEDITVEAGSIEVILKSEKTSGLTESIRAIYDDVQAYSWVTEKLTACSIQIENINGDVLLYLTGSLNSGRLSMWVSPQMEDDFVKNEGPKPVK